MTLGEKIQILRKQRGMSQEQLATKILVTRQAVSKWELSESLPDVDNIVQLSEMFGVTTDYLLKNGASADIVAPPDIPSENRSTTTRNFDAKQGYTGCSCNYIESENATLPDTETTVFAKGKVGSALKSPMIIGIIGMVFIGLNILRRGHENVLFPIAGVAIIIGMLIVFLPQLKILRPTDTGLRIGKFMTDVGIIAIIASGIFFRASHARIILWYASTIAWVGLVVIGLCIAHTIVRNFKRHSFSGTQRYL